MVKIMTTLIFRSEIPHDDLINVVNSQNLYKTPTTTKIGTHGVHVLARSMFLRTCCTVN